LRSLSTFSLHLTSERARGSLSHFHGRRHSQFATALLSWNVQKPGVLLRCRSPRNRVSSLSNCDTCEARSTF